MGWAREPIRELERPRHGGTAWKHGAEDFSSNLNPLGPPPEIDSLVKEGVNELDHYPDDRADSFREAVSMRYDLGTESVIAGAGSSELIRLFAETFMSPGEEAIMPHPCFSEYPFSCRLMGARPVWVTLRRERGFRPDPLEMLEEVGPRTKAVFLCNPHNPTGHLTPRKRIEELLQELEGKCMVFLDEALLELVKGFSHYTCSDLVEGHDNLFIINSLTKSFGCPGIRVGYGMGNPGVVERMDRARLSWNLGCLEQWVGRGCLIQLYDHVLKAREMMHSERSRMASQLKGLGLRIPLPDAFFFFVNLAESGVEPRGFLDELLSKGIMIRDCSSFGMEGHVRFAVKTPEKNDMLISHMGEVLG
ncbi:MAG: pyridoxal phosphate-dependent aminotransferase [Methanomassiliicoccales archaeon]